MAEKKIPYPLLSENEPVDWFFAFKFNSKTFPGGTINGKIPKFGNHGTPGLFGGTFQAYKHVKDNKGNVQTDKKKKPKTVLSNHGQQYAVASSKNPTLTKNNNECLGTTLNDPLGATFAQVYMTNDFNYLIWNDQFYGHPGGGREYPMGYLDKGTNRWINTDIPWGHSKGMLAWNDDGDGFVLQVSTPSWPASGSKLHPRNGDGNTLGCIKDDDVEVNQHFFCLKINVADLEIILRALNNASVVTDPTNPQLAKIGGPSSIQALVKNLGKVSDNTNLIINPLTKVSGVRIISKPSKLNAPPWQLVSAILGGVPLRVASWWAQPAISTTTSKTKIECWPQNGLEKPGPVEIALSGTWNKKTIGLKGSPTPGGNHAKLGVSKNSRKPYSIFGDMNQMGTLKKILQKENKNGNESTCNFHQDGRGGLFYVVENKKLLKSINALLTGDTAPQRPSKKKIVTPKKKVATQKKSPLKKKIR